MEYGCQRCTIHILHPMSGYRIAVDKGLFAEGGIPPQLASAKSVTYIDADAVATAAATWPALARDYTLLFVGDKKAAAAIAFAKACSHNPVIYVPPGTDEAKLAAYIFEYACTGDECGDVETENDPIEDGRELLQMCTVPTLCLDHYYA